MSDDPNTWASYCREGQHERCSLNCPCPHHTDPDWLAADAQRRQDRLHRAPGLTIEQKIAILAEYDAATERGAKTAVMRRHGINYGASVVGQWRAQIARARLTATA